ncbi:hypothetical protein AK812_SmicGene28700 [Symbiodinium microadriaticum]|uniref:Uncharacterized protein n=1 Tax=Symbiodinium microadriaticum TaxID=2951 RepID=A0A1Q9D3M8_SYMMI|nr:hypothetical protein AK812_SmicGene28700 [Symbiodinium microadriaticum]
MPFPPAVLKLLADFYDGAERLFSLGGAMSSSWQTTSRGLRGFGLRARFGALQRALQRSEAYDAVVLLALGQQWADIQQACEGALWLAPVLCQQGHQIGQSWWRFCDAAMLKDESVV